MTNVKFISFVATPGEKHLGICTVKFADKIILRYKIASGKDGKGIYANPASYKIVEDGEDRYIKAFALEMTSDNEVVMECVRKNSAAALQGNPVSQLAAPQTQTEYFVPEYGTPPF